LIRGVEDPAILTSQAILQWARKWDGWLEKAQRPNRQSCRFRGFAFWLRINRGD
jgi:hypothetical protein